MHPRPWALTFWLVAFAATALPGCYQQVVDAVVDDSGPDPGGMLTLTLGSAAPITTTALAKGDPMTIGSESPYLVVALACGDDAAGHSARDVLGTAGGQIMLTITSLSRTQMQVHTGGTSCVATEGTIELTAASDLSLSGTFSGDGHIASGDPCSMSGMFSAIPQAR